LSDVGEGERVLRIGGDSLRSFRRAERCLPWRRPVGPETSPKQIFQPRKLEFVTSFRRVIMPQIQKRMMYIPPAVMLLGIAGIGALAGLLGFVLAAVGARLATPAAQAAGVA
jgi:hypothetical protein